ncbi:LrgB family protein [Clostridium sp. UBA1056]|uniref:LrgB family protein n=1 Tax=unclassified Clostridium TaxID=2614128 RepID=UPI003216EF68
MKDLLCNSVFFGVVVSIVGYELGLFLKKKFNKAIFNPLLISIIFVMITVVIYGVDFESYNNGAKYLSYLLTPATVCLAIPLYQQLDLLKNNLKAIMLGIFSGVVSSLTSIFLFSLVFQFTHEQYVTLLPKSITTAIGMGISEELNGIVTITVAVIIVTGILGNIIAEITCKIFHIHEPIAKGIAIGTASHAIGTAKAMEMGEIEGAMSSLAIVVSGLLTVVGASIFANFI